MRWLAVDYGHKNDEPQLHITNNYRFLDSMEFRFAVSSVRRAFDNLTDALASTTSKKV